MTTCRHCGQPEVIDLVEAWGSDFQFETCCETLQDEVLWIMQNDPEGATNLALRMNAAEMTGRAVLSFSDDGNDHLVLNQELEFRPIAQRVAKDFIDDHHGHCPAPAGWRFGQGIHNGDLLVGVVWVGRPVAREVSQALVVEVNRLCFRRDIPLPLRHKGCSMAYRWAEAEACHRGFRKVITYTMDGEDGYSLRAARWKPEAVVKGRSWDTASRRRADRSPTCDKVRWTPAAMFKVPLRPQG